MYFKLLTIIYVFYTLFNTKFKFAYYLINDMQIYNTLNTPNRMNYFI